MAASAGAPSPTARKTTGLSGRNVPAPSSVTTAGTASAAARSTSATAASSSSARTDWGGTMVTCGGTTSLVGSRSARRQAWTWLATGSGSRAATASRCFGTGVSRSGREGTPCGP